MVEVTAILIYYGTLGKLDKRTHNIIEKPAALSIAGSFSILLTISAMVVVRDIVRTKYLEPHFNVNTLRVDSQWSVFILFAILLIVALGTLAFMVSKVMKAGKSVAANAE